MRITVPLKIVRFIFVAGQSDFSSGSGLNENTIDCPEAFNNMVAMNKPAVFACMADYAVVCNVFRDLPRITASFKSGPW